RRVRLWSALGKEQIGNLIILTSRRWIDEGQYTVSLMATISSVYDKGSFILKINGPEGWSWNPDKVYLKCGG
ncbi:unnamed protein product, partial [Brassica rapa]